MFSQQSSARKLYGEEISLHPSGETKRESSNRGAAVGPAGDQQSLNSRDKASAVDLPLPYLFFPLVFFRFRILEKLETSLCKFAYIGMDLRALSLSECVNATKVVVL
jgi:hypothetical protein